MKKKVVVGMSGGVDSSVAAYLLKEQGYEVIGVTMLVWQEPDLCQGEQEDSCCGRSAIEDARRVAEQLGIPHYVADFQKEFNESVIDYFIREYQCGRTPNPCIACNRFIKWESLLRRGMEFGADWIATGHYARILRLANGRYTLAKSAAAGKDQTYVLYSLTQEQLKHTLFPLGDYEKAQVRAIAQQAGLAAAHKPDSQEICFVPDHDYAAFIDREAGERAPKPGSFVTAEGRVLGRHKGISHYTIGQRRGLGLPMGERVFVTQICPETDQVVIGPEQGIFTDHALCDRVNFMSIEGLEKPMRVLAKIRYNHRGEYCTIERQSQGRVLAVFEKPVRAVTPGQAMVFYDGSYVAGGGTIIRQ